MGTAKITWDPTWSADTTIGSSHNDGAAPDQSAEYSNDDGMMHEFSAHGTYSAGTLDQPAYLYVLRKVEPAGIYEEQINAHMTVPLSGSSGSAFHTAFTVGPDVNAFIIEIDNDSNLDISGFGLDYKEGHVITT